MTRPACASCGVRLAHRRGVCRTCDHLICDGLIEDVRQPKRKPGRKPGPPRTVAPFAARFFSPEAVERRTAHTLARERARSR